MDPKNNIDENDDVVVIEQRDKRSYLYIGIAAVLGLALGGLIGSTVTSAKWESAYNTLETKYHQLTSTNSDLTQQARSDLDNANQALQAKIDEAVKQAKVEQAEKIAQLEKQVSELEKVNTTLDSKVTEQKQELAKADAANTKLVRKTDIQAGVFERSRELFQKELTTKQELESLQKERDSLVPKIAALKKECDVYLAGTSWDATSDSCDKQDQAKARLSQLDQMIHVHQLDLQQMKELADEIGVN